MTLENLAQISNYAVASATGILALAFVAYVAQWGFARNVAPERELVNAGSVDVVTNGSDPVERSNMAGGIGLSLTTLSAAILLIGVVTRGLAAERVPWGNMYEFGCAATLAALTAYLVLERVWEIEWVGPIITGFGTVVLGASAMVYVPAGPLVPALHSYWLVIHVLGAIISGSAFLVGAAASVLYLVKSRAERNTPEDQRAGFLWRIPASAKIDQVAYRVHAFAFPIWTFAALIAGPIWAQYAWAATGAGTPRRSGRSSPGLSTPATCTPARPPAGRARPRRSWR